MSDLSGEGCQWPVTLPARKNDSGGSYTAAILRLNLQRVPIDTLAHFMVAVAAHPHSNETIIAQFAGNMSVATAKRAIPVLMSLCVISKGANGTYQCSRPEVQRGMALDHSRLILKRALHNYRPFEAVCEGLLLGETQSEATRRAAIILSIENADALDLLVQWGLELGILRRDGITLGLSEEVISNTVALSHSVISSKEITSEAAARLYNSFRIGREANNFLDEVDRTLLASAQLECQDSPDDALEKAGQALEDYLREVSTAKNLRSESAGCNGAGQLGALLVNKGVIHSHQNQLIQAISTARNMTAHHKDKRTLAPWHISEQAARWGLSGTLLIIRSIHEYVFRGQQTL